MRFPSDEKILWQFDTANFRVVCHAEQEDMDPADSFDDAADIAAIRDGSVDWFCAMVSVWYGTDENNLTYLAHDVLGGCAYKHAADFITGHRDSDPENRNTLAMKASNRAICHYFPGMVSQAISGARKAAQLLKAIPLRH